MILDVRLDRPSDGFSSGHVAAVEPNAVQFIVEMSDLRMGI